VSNPAVKAPVETPPARVTVRLLEKDYQFACPSDERAHLLDCAEYLNGKMREIRDSGKIVGLDRVAVMAALNIADELLKLRARGGDLDGSSAARVRALRERVEGALNNESRQLTLE
jgi:cell division protein ZapA